MLEKKAFSAIKTFKMLERGDKILVALSGGPDSVALLYFLKKSGKNIAAAHLNHCIRKKDAIADEKFVKELCSVWKIPLYVKRADINKLSKKNKVSLEEAGRNERYLFFESLAAKKGFDKIALAHNADDNVETFLMRLLRGTGLKGLCGIPPKRGKIIRPLIGVWKKDILRYCKAKHLRYRTDETNFVPKFTRNKVRNVIIPELERKDPRIKSKVLGCIRGFRKDYELLSEYLGNITKKILKEQKQGVLIDRGALEELPKGIKGHVVRKAVEKIKGDLINIESRHIENILSLEDGYTCLPNGLFVFADERSFLVTHKKDTNKRLPDFKLSLDIPGRTKIKHLGKYISASVTAKVKDLKKTPSNRAYIDLDRIKGKRLMIRNFREGDRFVPLGMNGTKKLQDYFVDKKISLKERGRIPLVFDGEKLLWVAGHRIDDRAKVSPGTKKILQLDMI